MTPKLLNLPLTIGASLCAALMLAGCAGGSLVPDGKEARRAHSKAERMPSSPSQAARPRMGAAIPNAPFATADARQCVSELHAAGVRFTPLPDKHEGSGCSTINSIKVMDFGTPTTNTTAMTCPLAKNFAAWARYAVQPAAQMTFGSPVVKIETMGTYSCRNIYGGRSGRLSQHAFANAVDVSAFILADGRRVSVLNDWEGGTREKKFLRLIHGSACRRFGTVLSPEYNAAHADHFHFDMSGKGFCR